MKLMAEDQIDTPSYALAYEGKFYKANLHGKSGVTGF